MSENTQAVDVNEVRHPNWPEGYTNYMTVIEAAEALNFKYPNYARTLVSKEKLTGVKITLGKQVRWAIDPESVEHYRTHRGSFGSGRRGKGGVRRMLVRIDLTKTNAEEFARELEEVFGDKVLSAEKAYQGSSSSSDDEEDSDEEAKEWKVATLDSLVPDEEADDGMDL